MTGGKNQILLAADEAKDPRAAFTFTYNLAHFLLEVGSWEESLAMYDRILPRADREERRSINYERARIFDRLGRRTEAVWLLREILSEAPDFLPASVSMIDLMVKDGRWREAKRELAALRADRGPLPVLMAYEKQIMIQESLEERRSEPGPEPLDAKTLVKVGRANFEAGEWEQAIASFREAYRAADAAKDGDRALEALRYLARTLRQAKRPREAALVIDQALRLRPDDVRFLQDRGHLFAEDIKDFQEALVAYRRLGELARDGATRIEAALGLGDLFREKGAIEDAVGWYEKAAALGTVPSVVHRHRGELWERLGRIAEARAAYEAYVRSEVDAAARREVEDHLRDPI